MDNMFNNCFALVTVPQFNTIKVTTMFQMFQSSGSLKTIPVFNTSNVGNIANIFQSCASLQTVPSLNFSNVTSANFAFTGCSSLINTGVLDFNKVIGMTNIFQNCSALQDASNIANVGNVTNVFFAFSSCQSLNSLPPSWNLSKVTNMDNFASSCTVLQNFPAYNTINVTVNTSFLNATNSLVTVPALNFSNVTTSGAIFGASVNKINITGMKVTHSLVNSSVGQEELQNYFANSIVANATSQTLTVTNTPGATALVAKASCAFTSGSQNITIPNNTSLVAPGMFVTGSTIQGTYSASITIGTTDQQFEITGTGAGIATSAPQTDTPIYIVTSTLTGLNAGTVYYIKSRNAFYTGGFTLTAALDPGTVITFTASGTMTYRPSYTLEQIVSSVQARILPSPITSNSAITLNFRVLNMSMATAKNWTITG
jgi:surface protein